MKVESKDSDVKILEQDCLSGGGYYMPNVVLYPSIENPFSVAPVPCSACMFVKGIAFFNQKQESNSDIPRPAIVNEPIPRPVTPKQANPHPDHANEKTPRPAFANEPIPRPVTPKQANPHSANANEITPRPAITKRKIAPTDDIENRVKLLRNA